MGKDAFTNGPMSIRSVPEFENFRNRVSILCQNRLGVTPTLLTVPKRVLLLVANEHFLADIFFFFFFFFLFLSFFFFFFITNCHTFIGYVSGFVIFYWCAITCILQENRFPVIYTDHSKREVLSWFGLINE